MSDEITKEYQDYLWRRYFVTYRKRNNEWYAEVHLEAMEELFASNGFRELNVR